MKAAILALVGLLGCGRDQGTRADLSLAEAPARPRPKPAPWQYRSDCSLTNPIARDPCTGAGMTSRGLKACTALGVTKGQACKASAPSCVVERTCKDGHVAIADFLVCAKQTPSRCMTRSSRTFKDDVHYLSREEVTDLARQIAELPLARYRYSEEAEGRHRLGFLVEDVPGAPFVEDATAVDLYALLTASIAALQVQDERIRALETRLGACPSSAQLDQP